jgi:hypothetical protein
MRGSRKACLSGSVQRSRSSVGLAPLLAMRSPRCPHPLGTILGSLRRAMTSLSVPKRNSGRSALRCVSTTSTESIMQDAKPLPKKGLMCLHFEPFAPCGKDSSFRAPWFSMGGVVTSSSHGLPWRELGSRSLRFACRGRIFGIIGIPGLALGIPHVVPGPANGGKNRRAGSKVHTRKGLEEPR